MSNKVIKNQVIRKFVDIFDDYLKVNLPIENDYYVCDIDITDNIIEFFIQRKVLLMYTSFASRFNFVVKN